MENKYENLDKFSRTIHSLNDSLGNKYQIKEYGFDVECIYQKEDLTKLVKEMLTFGEFEFKLIEDGHDDKEKQYYSIFKVGDENYEFRTSSRGDYVDLETILPSLDKIVQKYKSGYEYNFSNADGGQIAIMIFAKTTNLIKAVDEGFPCSLPSGYWKREIDWNWGFYSDVQVEDVPNFEDLKSKYHEVLTNLFSEGYDVPNLTINRIYIDDVFKNNRIDIYVDGGPTNSSSNDILDNTIRCFWDASGIILAYTLIKKYNGEPIIYDKTKKKNIQISKEDYLEKVKKALGKRK